MAVPVFEEVADAHKLGEKAVVAHLGQPFDKVQHILHRIAPFDDRAAVAEGSGFAQGKGKLGGRKGGHCLAVCAWAQETAAQPPQRPINADQKGAGVGGKDAAAALFKGNFDSVVQRRVGDGKTFRRCLQTDYRQLCRDIFGKDPVNPAGHFFQVPGQLPPSIKRRGMGRGDKDSSHR